jgi:DoxX-like protein
MTSQTFPTSSRRQVLTGRVLTGLAVAFLLFDTVLKVAKLPAVVQGTAQLGYPAHLVLGIGIIELVCLALYAIPRTAVLGAILLTGYLGGAVATHVRVQSPLFSHILFPVYVALLIWGGLYLRDERLRALIPLRRA